MSPRTRSGKASKSGKSKSGRRFGPPPQPTGAAAHKQWLGVLDLDGAFLSVPVLTKRWSTVIPALAPEVRTALGDARREFEKAWDVWDQAARHGYQHEDSLQGVGRPVNARPAWVQASSAPVAQASSEQSLDLQTLDAAQGQHGATQEGQPQQGSGDAGPLKVMRHAQQVWLEVVFSELFGWALDNDGLFCFRDDLPGRASQWQVHSPDGGVCAEPCFVMHRDGVHGMIVQVIDPVGGETGSDDAGLRRAGDDGWAASPIARMEQLLVASGVPLGVVTDGRFFGLVFAGREVLPASGVWDCFAWSDEPVAPAALAALMSPSQVVGGREDERLAKLFEQSVDAAEEITEGLGTQVRQAVELLVTALARSQQQAKLHFEHRQEPVPEAIVVAPEDTYQAAVSAMMRVIFLLYAGERGLLPSQPLFADSYGLVGVYDDLKQREKVEGPEALDATYFAWYRLLATSRALFSGASFAGDDVPAYGGTLFDPQRFPQFSVEDPQGGLAVQISDRVMLAVLEAVQVVDIGKEARRVSFRNIDVEQIGYMYEGLLGYTAETVDKPIVGLHGAPGVEPEVPLAVLEELQQEAGDDADAMATKLLAWTKKHQPAAKGLTKAKLSKLLELFRDTAESERLAAVATSDPELQQRLAPWMGLVRNDLRGAPMVLEPGSVVVVETSARGDAGAHYTPKNLAEEVVRYTLEPLVYSPGPHQEPDATKWKIRPSHEILDLKVADIACGSGAFLVSAARYLAEKVLEAQFAEGNIDSLEKPVAGQTSQHLVRAIRKVVSRCLYGADINPLAVEMCKLSLWLVSLDKNQPFTFVDDKLLVGNSLLGVTSRKQLEDLRLAPAKTQQTSLAFGEQVAQVDVDLAGVLSKAASLRQALATEVREDDPSQTRAAKVKQLEKFRDDTATLTRLADGIVSTALLHGGKPGKRLDEAYQQLRAAVATAFPAKGDGNPEPLQKIITRGLTKEHPTYRRERWRPLHWAVELPHIVDSVDGFDAIIGNPPFLGGKKITPAAGSRVREYLVNCVGHGTPGNADLSAYFVLQSHALLAPHGCLGLIATNTLAQGDTREVGLDQIANSGFTITRSIQSKSWPSKSANLEYAAVWGTREIVADSTSRVADGISVAEISTLLEPSGRIQGKPARLQENADIAFVGCYVLGMGFIIDPQEAHDWIAQDEQNAEVLFPYLNGKDLNSRPDSSPSRWVIDFEERKQEEAGKFSAPWERVESTVKAERQAKDGEKYPRMVDEWWKFWNGRAGLRKAIASLDQVLAIALVGSAVMPCRVATGTVFSHALGVFATDSFSDQAVLSSSLHRDWAVQYGSSMRADIRYTPSDVFETFPRPEPTDALHALGEELHTVRQEVMLSRELGLTKLYNLINDPDCSPRDRDVRTLRDIHERLDHAVVAAYDWDDVPLDHGFHTYRQHQRWTVSPAARVELMDRLLEENHRRHALEQKQLQQAQHQEQQEKDAKKKRKKKSS